MAGARERESRERTRSDAGEARAESAAPVRPTAAAEVLQLQRTAGNAAVQRMLGERAGLTAAPQAAVMRDPPPLGADLPRDKALTHKMIGELQGKLEGFATAERRWLSANWIDYFSSTSQNPRLAWGPDAAYGAFSNALGNATSLAVEQLIKRAAAKAAAGATGAAVGGAVGNVPGAIVGFILGVLIETAVGFILDRITGKASSEDQAAADAAVRAGALIQAQEKALDAHEDKGRAEAKKQAELLRGRVEAATAPEQVYEIQRDAFESGKEADRQPSRDDRGLATHMLREWVLEHAGDEEDANTETSEAQWEAGRTRVFGEGDSLDGHPEIFAYQSRAHWSGLGFDGAGTAAEMIKQASAPGATVKTVMDAWDGKTIEFTSSSRPDALIATIERGHKRMSDEGKKAIRENRFKLKAKLSLDDADGAVYVDDWEYELTFVGPDALWWAEERRFTRGARLREAFEADDRTVDFTISPD